MHCPHCGAKNQEGNRYCVGCGSELATAGAASAPISRQDRLKHLIGKTPRARAITAATAAALAIALAAFVALEPSEEAAPNDSFKQALDQTCVIKKRTLAALEQQTVQQQPSNIQAFSGALVLIVQEWRDEIRNSPAPPVHAEAVRELDAALLDVLIKSGGLARAARAASPQQVAAEAKLVDAASAQVDQAVDDIGLERCSGVEVGTVAGRG